MMMTFGCVLVSYRNQWSCKHDVGNLVSPAADTQSWSFTFPGMQIPLCRACKALCEDGWLNGIDPWRKTGVSSASEKSDWRKSLFSTLAGSSLIIFFMLSSSVTTSCSYMREESDSLNGPGCHQFNGTVQIRKEMLHDGAYPCLWQNCITPAVVQASMENYLQCNFHLHKHTQEKWFG